MEWLPKSIKEPFAVINADDYYDKEAFVKVHDYLVKINEANSTKGEYCMAGFLLRNTLSDNGGVTRGVCQIDKDFYLTKVTETHNIVKTHGDVGFSDGAAVIKDNEKIRILDADYYVFMNMLGLTTDFMDILEGGFARFLSSLEPGDIKSEYLLPTIIDGLIHILADTEKIYLEPSACAGIPGIVKLFKNESHLKYLKKNNLTDKMSNLVHIAWATGGSLVPKESMDEYYRLGLQRLERIG